MVECRHLVSRRYDKDEAMSRTIFPGVTFLGKHERAVVQASVFFGEGKVAGPGLAFHIPLLGYITVVNLDRSIPEWNLTGTMSEETLRELVEFLATRYYPVVPENMPVRIIREQMTRVREGAEEREKVIAKAVSLVVAGHREEAIEVVSEEHGLTKDSDANDGILDYALLHAIFAEYPEVKEVVERVISLYTSGRKKEAIAVFVDEWGMDSTPADMALDHLAMEE